MKEIDVSADARRKLRVIVKHPDERIGHSQHIDNDFETIEWLMQGAFDVVDVGLTDVVMLMSRKHTDKHMQYLLMGYIPETADSTIAMIGVDGPEFTDCDWSLDDWKLMLKAWGNVAR